MSRKTFNKNTTKKIFAGLVIAQTGDFGTSRTHDKIEGWILSAGGTLARTIGADITHLLCTEEDWKKKVAKGALPLSRGPSETANSEHQSNKLSCFNTHTSSPSTGSNSAS